jgi:glutamine cyclotransferase
MATYGRNIILVVVLMLSTFLQSCSSDTASTDNVNLPNPEGSNGASISILKSFESPLGTQPTGLTWHNGFLWMSSYILNPGIYKINPNTGYVENLFLPDIVWDNRYGGLSTDGLSLFHLQANNGKTINVLDSENVNTIRTFSIQSDGWNYSDSAIQGDSIWSVAIEDSFNPGSYNLLKISAIDGAVLGTYNVPDGTQVNHNYGMTFDGIFIWLSSGNKIFKISPDNGNILGTFEVSFGPEAMSNNRLESLAWDGNHLWGASFYGTIYQFNISENNE